MEETDVMQPGTTMLLLIQLALLTCQPLSGCTVLPPFPRYIKGKKPILGFGAAMHLVLKDLRLSGSKGHRSLRAAGVWIIFFTKRCLEVRVGG